MNETLFFLHLLLSIALTLCALKLGKNTLIAWIALQAVIANIFVLKQINFFGLNITCGDVYIIGSVLGSNLLQEYFGKEEAKKALWTSFFLMGGFVAMAAIHLLYTPSGADTTQSSFTTLLSPSARLLFASFGVFFLVQQLDIRLFSLLQKTRAPFWMRSGVSVLLTQLVDTVLFSFLGLYGLVTSIVDVIIISLIIKWAVIGGMTPFLSFAKQIFPRKSP